MRRCAAAVACAALVAAAFLASGVDARANAPAAAPERAAFPPIEELLADLFRVGIHIPRGPIQYAIKETVQTVATTLHESPSQQAVHDSLARLYAQGGLAKKWIVSSVCGAVTVTAQDNLTWSGTGWKDFLRRVVTAVAENALKWWRGPIGTYFTLTSKADKYMTRIANTWDLAQMNPRLALWYWQACSG